MTVPSLGGPGIPGPLVLAAVFLVVTGALAVGAAADDEDVARGSPSISAHAPEAILVPGQETSLEIYLNNRGRIDSEGAGQLESEVQVARATTVRIDDEDVPLTVRTGTTPIGDVGTGVTGPIEFTVVPDENATPGEYEVPVVLNYEYTERAELDDGIVKRRERTVTRTRSVTVEISDRARFAVVDTEADVAIGAVGPTSVTVENVGHEPARNASMTVEAVDADASFPSGTSFTDSFAGHWAPNETRTIDFRVELTAGAEPRPYPLEVTVDFRDGLGVERTSRTLRADLEPLPEQTFDVSDVEADLRVGADGTFEGTLVNEGPWAVENAVVLFSNEAPAADGVATEGVEDPNVLPRDPQHTVGDLEPGENGTFGFETGLRSDADPGNRTLNVVVRYRTPHGDLAVSDVLDVPVWVEPEREPFAVEPVDATLERGYSGPYRVNVTNTGGEPLSDVEAKFFPDGPLSSDDDEAFVRELEPNETVQLTFHLDVETGAQLKTYGASIDFRYDDADGESKLSEAQRVPVTVERQSGGRPIGTILGITTLLALLAGGLGWIRRDDLSRRLDESGVSDRLRD